MSNRIIGFLIKSQQYYLKELGFYLGEIDGIWNAECVDAIELFKLDAGFYPANVRRENTPFIPFERLPKGFKWEILDGQRCILKDSSLPYIMTIQNLVDSILGVGLVKSAVSRDARSVLGIKISNAPQIETANSGSDPRSIAEILRK